MVDFHKPLQTVRSKRRLYVTGWDDGYMLDTRDNHSGTGFRYRVDGMPADGCPYGQVENVPDNDIFLGMETVDPSDALTDGKLAQRHAEAAAVMRRDNASNPLWGMF